MTDLDIYVSIAAGLEESGWSAVLSGLDKETFDKISNALDSVKDVADVPEEELKADPVDAIQQLNKKMTKIMKALKAHRKRFQRLDSRMTAIEAGGGGSTQSYEDSLSAPSVKRVIKKKKKLKSMKGAKSSAADDIKEDGSSSARKHFYRFGYRNVMVIKPSQGYPIPKEAKRPVEGKLSLFFSHGYSGNFDESRQNICLSKDGNKLMYYIAAVCVVFDYKKMKQRFFTRHNDDLTSLCVCPFKPWAATGQKDPKDTPGKGKDLPKIWIWNYKNMKPVQLIDNVCWGKIARLQWSSASKLLYCICGDPEQTLKAYDPEQFTGKKQPDELCKCSTMKEVILGFEINPNPNKVFVDEFVMYGKRKFCFISVSKAKKGLTVKIKAVSITTLKKDGEKSFGCCAWLPDGRYVVGAKSGAMYIGRGNQALTVVGNAHSKSIGCILFDGEALLTAGHDLMLKRWSINSSNASGSGDEAPAIGKKKVKKNAKKSGKKTPRAGASPSGGAALTETWSHLVDIPESDFILQPKAMVFDATNMCLFVGTKTNQIMRFEMKDESAEVIVDGHDGQIWGLATHPEEALFVTGGYDNAIKVWDANTSKCIKTYEFEIAQGEKGKQISCAAWSNDGTTMVFGTEDSCVAVFSWVPEFQFQQMIEIPPKSKNAEVEPVSYLRFSEDSSLLAAAHMDSNLYIFSVNGGGSHKIVLQRWDGLPHVAAPTNVQFSKSGKLVKTLTRDYEICHWILNADSHQGKFLARIPDPDQVEWADDPLIAGWDVQGLYQRGWDGTDLNDATVTSDSKLIVSGDDYGTIRLHNYPAIDAGACVEYSGHAEFVVGVEFLRDDSQLISCGGNDMAIFQWRLDKNYK